MAVNTDVIYLIRTNIWFCYAPLKPCFQLVTVFGLFNKKASKARPSTRKYIGKLRFKWRSFITWGHNPLHTI